MILPILVWAITQRCWVKLGAYELCRRRKDWFSHFYVYYCIFSLKEYYFAGAGGICSIPSCALGSCLLELEDHFGVLWIESWLATYKESILPPRHFERIFKHLCFGEVGHIQQCSKLTPDFVFRGHFWCLGHYIRY